MPVQPIAATVRTSCSGSNLASRRGSDSSRRTRTGGQQVSDEFENGDRLFTAHGGKVVQELVQGVPASEVVYQILHGNAGPTEDRRAPKNLWIAVNDGVHRRHVAHRTPDPRQGRSGPSPPGHRRRRSQALLARTTKSTSQSRT